jgi:hypothetical protein
MHERWNVIKHLSSLSNSIPRSVQYYELIDCCFLQVTIYEIFENTAKFEALRAESCVQIVESYSLQRDG